MKIEKQTDNTFKPVTISITFETKEELESIFHIMGYNHTIPEFFENTFATSVSSKQAKFFGDFMSYMHRILRNEQQ